MDVLVGTESGLVEAGSGRTVAHPGRDVGAMAGDWVVLDRRQLCGPGGALGPHLDGPPVTCIDSNPGPEPLVGTAEAHLFRMGDEPVRVHGFDLAEGRGQWYTPWGGPPDVRSVCTLGSGTILVNVHVGGILRSDDDGANWRATIDLDHDVHQVLAADGWTVAACAHGLATSHDDGKSWDLHDEGLNATYSRAVAVSGGTVLLSTSLGPHGEQAALYRRPLGSGGPFERCHAGLPEDLGGNVDTFWLAGGADGSAAFATRSGQVHVSADEGATWEQAATGLPPVRCLVLG